MARLGTAARSAKTGAYPNRSDIALQTRRRGGGRTKALCVVCLLFFFRLVVIRPLHLLSLLQATPGLLPSSLCRCLRDSVLEWVGEWP